MRHINYESDFDFLLRITDADGTPIGEVAYDWRLDIHTAFNPNAVYTAKCEGGVYTNCLREGDCVRIICDGHGLKPGKLVGRWEAIIPSVEYPDGARSAVRPFYLS